MRSIKYTLLADGTSDEVLIPIINWAILQVHEDFSISGQFAKNLGPVGNHLENKVTAALKAYPCQILFVHRDGEGQSLQDRVQEIESAMTKMEQIYVPIVPIKMTEAWLLGDEAAIRIASGNPNGEAKLSLPKRKTWESCADPKQQQFEALIAASEKSGRALRKFSPEKQRGRVSSLTKSFEHLRGIPSFDSFEATLAATLERI